MNNPDGHKSSSGAQVISLTERLAQRKRDAQASDPQSSTQPAPTSPRIDDPTQVIRYDDIRLPKDVAEMYDEHKRNFPELFHRANRLLLSRIEQTRRLIMEQVPALGLGMIVLQIADNTSRALQDQIWEYLEIRDGLQDIDIDDYFGMRPQGKIRGRLRINREPEEMLPESPRMHGVKIHPIFAAHPKLRKICPHLASNEGLVKRILRARMEVEKYQSKLHFSSVEFYLRSNDPYAYEPEVKEFLNFMDQIEGKKLAHIFNLTFSPESRDEYRGTLYQEEFEGICDRVVMQRTAHNIMYNSNRSPIVHIRKNDEYRYVTAEQQASSAKPEERFFYREKPLVAYLRDDCDVRI